MREGKGGREGGYGETPSNNGHDSKVLGKDLRISHELEFLSK